MSITLMLAAAFNAQCIEQQLQHGDDSQTLAQLRQRCAVIEPAREATAATPTDSAATATTDIEVATAQPEIERRFAQEKAFEANRYGLSSHMNNYVLLASYNANANEETWEYSPEGISPWEVKFQFSFKVPVTPNWFGNDNGLYLAYTNQSWWQAYNKDVSAPFRDTNHMPELMWLHFFDDVHVGDWRLLITNFSLNHQSNGRSGEQSRSWNRLIATTAFQNDHWVVGARAWYRLPEDDKEFATDPKGDDNPDITDFMGHGELFGIYARDDHNFSLRARGNITQHKGGVELGWSFPLKGKLRGYVQSYYGYGENLLDYNHKAERLSVGVELTPIL
ncbi:phospholipase A [uncultured Ferrimonas sp.]|uniref:phospholipase A n=1 Tax=uncultured Ferrimonas sp. TaxID=432640 RepID=UPI00262D6DCB|nr:phospholipase A [uncultured Ferrimonas sp.]